ncbi:hypothetical protein GCM10009839_45660 [Catenulispora yoronensis]|uniref:Methyltransferase n=1 Tax=Catenulispora yoronensis TaxID=450799 RepID=A0ABN2UJB9_9ACTN
MTPAALPDDDAACLRDAAEFVRDHETDTLLRLLLPGLDGPETRALTDRCRFSHAALLVFPEDPDALRRDLAACGLAIDAEPQPSVVVRARLAARYRRDPADLDVRILRPEVLGLDGNRRMVEVFALTTPPDSDLRAIAALERWERNEAHVAFEVDWPDPLVLHGLRSILARHGATPDGGGYNPHEDGTVFYYAAPADSKAGYRRMELFVRGDHQDVLDVHLAEHRAGQAGNTLLTLFTGAWTTQALAAFAELRIPDAMSAHAGTDTATLAQVTGTHPDRLARLLRYLAALGIVTGHRNGFRLTEAGALLREDGQYSMRPLALMYGGPFYESFSDLAHTVRTGQEAFEHRFGENHFAHFAGRPELADLFQRSMAASSRMFDPVPDHPVFARAAARRVVVDVAGGNGELLARILTAHPHLRGTLLEQPHVVESARRTMRDADCAERCDYVSGGFADVPSGGDVYVLSRVLHDWEDDRCHEILGACSRAMAADADLLVVERVLADHGPAALATAWDLHMMCNVGGRERGLGHYQRLFAAAGLELVATSPLPLDATLMHVRKSSGLS